MPKKTYTTSQKQPDSNSAGWLFSSLLDDPHHILLNETQAANFLGLTKRTLQQRRYCSLPPQYIKLPGSNAIRYRLSDLMEFVAAGEVPLP